MEDIAHHTVRFFQMKLIVVSDDTRSILTTMLQNNHAIVQVMNDVAEAGNSDDTTHRVRIWESILLHSCVEFGWTKERTPMAFGKGKCDGGECAKTGRKACPLDESPEGRKSSGEHLFHVCILQMDSKSANDC